MPEWVLDAVIVHELAHLLEASHSAAFKALCERYPRHAEAEAYLLGFEHGGTLASTVLGPPAEQSWGSDDVDDGAGATTGQRERTPFSQLTFP